MLLISSDWAICGNLKPAHRATLRLLQPPCTHPSTTGNQQLGSVDRAQRTSGVGQSDRNASGTRARKNGNLQWDPLGRTQCMPRMPPLDMVLRARATEMEMETAKALTSPLLYKYHCHSRTWGGCSWISANTLGSCHPPHGRRRHSYCDSSMQSSNRRSCLQPRCRHPHPRNPDLASGWLSMCLETERATEMEEQAANTAHRTCRRRQGIDSLADCMVARRPEHSNKPSSCHPWCPRSGLGSQCTYQCNTIRILPNPSCTNLAQKLQVKGLQARSQCGALVCG